VTFYGHDKVGSQLATRALRRLRLEAELVERVAALVRYHMLPLPRGERAARRFVHRRRALLPDLLKLMIADREAARGPLASAAGRAAYRVALGQVVAIMGESPPQPPLLSGNEVMTLLNLAPGPRVGEALALVAEARALGDVANESQARELLLRYARAQGWDR
jgi:poly(A) polymerase